jgi:hypothetical protein
MFGQALMACVSSVFGKNKKILGKIWIFGQSFDIKKKKKKKKII